MGTTRLRWTAGSMGRRKKRRGGVEVEGAADPPPGGDARDDQVMGAEQQPLLESGTTRLTTADEAGEGRGVSDAGMGEASPEAATAAPRLPPSIPASTIQRMRGEAPPLLALAGPLLGTNVLGYVMIAGSVVAVGKLGAGPLAVCVLGNSLFNTTGYSVLMGLSMGLDTVCGQAWGAREYLRLGSALQLALLVCALGFVPVAALWTFMEPLLDMAGQDPGLAHGVAEYLRWMLPGLLAGVLVECLKRYQQGQGIVKPAVIATFSTAAVGPLVLTGCVHYPLHMGAQGAALGITVLELVQACILLGFVVHRHRKVGDSPEQTWGGWALRTAMKDWRAYLSLSLPAMVMLCAEWWSFELAIVLSGYMSRPDTAVATMGVLFSITAIAYMIPLSFSQAVSTRVANMLGANDAEGAKAAALFALLCATAGVVAITSVFWCFTAQSIALVTTDPDVVRMSTALAPLVVLSMVGDHHNCVLGGVVRGLGDQHAGAKANLVGHYAIGAPLGVLLTFKFNLGLQGLWIGLTSATTVSALLMARIVLKTDWADAARQAQERPGGGGTFLSGDGAEAEAGYDDLSVPLLADP